MLALLIAASTSALEPPALRPELEPLAFLVGHCWRGELPRQAGVDRHCFDTVYDGQHIRDTHEVTGGSGTYAGETFYSAGDSGGVDFTYFNSLGGVSRGTMQADDEGLHVGDENYRGADGKEIKLSISWRRVGDDAYEVTTSSADAPGMNGTVRYERVSDKVAISEAAAVDGTLMLVHEAEVAAPVEAVWEAITTPEGWRSWAVPVAWSSADEPDILETSYNPAAVRGDSTTIRHRVLARVPGRMIAFRTVKAPQGFPHFDLFSRTTGLFELEPLGESRSLVRTIGAGYPDSDAGRELIGFFREGNRITLERLQRRFREGPVDWAQEGTIRKTANR